MQYQQVYGGTENMNRNSKWFRILFLVIAAIFVISTCAFINAKVQDAKAQKEYERLQELARKQQEEEEKKAQEEKEQQEKEEAQKAEKAAEEEAARQAALEKEARRKSFPIDFKALRKQNEDIFAWITIPDTVIDYPVLCHPADDTYYLDHDPAGNQIQPGAIFIESINSLDMSDSNTVIYGHNQRDQSMFGSLHRYENQEYFNSHPTILIYTKDFKKLTYTVFSCGQIDDSYILEEPSMNEDTALFQSYLDSLQSSIMPKQHLRKDVLVTSADKIITLSTCENGGQNDRRFIIQAVLTSSEEY